MNRDAYKHIVKPMELDQNEDALQLHPDTVSLQSPALKTLMQIESSID